jgi:hypothetical protein
MKVIRMVGFYVSMKMCRPTKIGQNIFFILYNLKYDETINKWEINFYIKLIIQHNDIMSIVLKWTLRYRWWLLGHLYFMPFRWHDDLGISNSHENLY